MPTKTENVPDELTTDQLRGLIRIRAEIQIFNLDLLDHMNEFGFDNMEPFHNSFCQTLLGSNFSLWRYAFLLYVEKEPLSVFQAMQSFISKLAEDNTMLFSREVANQAWFGGYYGNNSRYRIQRLIEKIEKEYDAKAVESIDGACDFHKKMEKFYDLQINENISVEDSLSALTIQFEMQKRLFDFIKSRANT